MLSRAKKLKDLGFIFAVFILFSASCSVVGVSEIPEYPITIEPLGLLELDELNTQYQAENEGRICSTLNEYGFTGYSRVLFPNNVNPCSDKRVVRIELTDTSSLIKTAKRELVKNVEYTNVTREEDLEVQELLPLYGCTICEGPNTNSVPLEWKITFQPQKKNNVEVYNTEIRVFIDANGVNRIWGNWYSDIYAPGLLDVGYTQAKETVIGTEIALQPITGQDSTLSVSLEMLGEPDFQFVPYKNSEGALELRKVWKIPIHYNYQEITQLWAQVDVVDGQLLQIVPHPEININ